MAGRRDRGARTPRIPVHPLPVPADHGVGADPQRPPGRTQQPLGQGGEDEAVARLQARPAGGALEHAELVSQHQDLKLAVAVFARHQRIHEHTKNGVDDRQQHRALLLLRNGELEIVSNPRRGDSLG